MIFYAALHYATVGSMESDNYCMSRRDKTVWQAQSLQ